MRPAPVYAAALSPLLAGAVMVLTAPLTATPLLTVICAGIVALGALPMLLTAWWVAAQRGVDVLRGLLVLSVIGVADLVHFNVRAASLLHGDLAFLHPATAAPTLVVSGALAWMWLRTPVTRLLAQPRD